MGNGAVGDKNLPLFGEISPDCTRPLSPIDSTGNTA